MRVAAAQSVRSGRTVSLAHERPVDDPTGVRKFSYENFHYTDAQPEEAGTIDEVGAIYHGYTITHLDALCHLFTPEGARGDVQRLPDLAGDRRGRGEARRRADGRPRHRRSRRPARHRRAQGRAAPAGQHHPPRRPRGRRGAPGRRPSATGDILFIRNGGGAGNSYQKGTGLHPDCLPWLHAREIAALGHDGDGDVHPPQPGFARWTEPVHMVLIPYLGMPLICGCDLEAIAAACAEEGRWSFFLTLAPWRFKGATSSPVNPIAMF